jgi:hypothetical protein
VPIGWRQAGSDLVDEEPQLLHLVARIQAMAPLAALRYHDTVPLLPGTQGSRRDSQHLRHRADAVYGPISRFLTLHGKILIPGVQLLQFFFITG